MAELDLNKIVRELYERLTGKEGAVSYEFDDLTVEVPRDFGADAPRAVWKLSGTLHIRSEAEESSS